MIRFVELLKECSVKTLNVVRGFPTIQVPEKQMLINRGNGFFNQVINSRCST